MLNRRDALALGAGGLMTGLLDLPGASAAPATPATAAPTAAPEAPEAPRVARLETRLFNFKDDVSAQRIDEIASSVKELSKASGIDGLTFGRNLDATPFATRFEWIYMIQFDMAPEGPGTRAAEAFERWKAELTSLCRNEVECDLHCPLPKRFADASGVKVRHTVMFDFKADASAEARYRNVAAIRRMGQLPMVQHYLVERTVARKPGEIQMEWQLIGDFASLEDYRAYSDAPVHLAIRDDFTAHTSRVAFLDVRIAG